MKIYIICDLEGTAGVINHHEQCCWDLSKQWVGAYYEQARRLATLELNALVEGAVEGGATDITAWDGHGNFPGGIDIELLHPECKLVMGAGDAGPAGLDNTYNAMFQLGLHAMAGTKSAVLAHTFHGGIEKYMVNDMAVGEIWMNCYTAGLQDVPCVFLAGDRAASEEVKKITNPVETAVVKWSLSEEVTALKPSPSVNLSPTKARELIKEKAKAAMKLVEKAKPYKITPTLTLTKKLRKKEEPDWCERQPGVERVDEFTVRKKDAEFAWELL